MKNERRRTEDGKPRSRNLQTVIRLRKCAQHVQNVRTDNSASNSRLKISGHQSVLRGQGMGGAACGQTGLLLSYY